MIDLTKCQILERIPGKVSGVWLLKGTRLPLWVVLDNLSSGASLDEGADGFEMDRKQVEAILAFLARETEQALSVETEAAAK